MVGVGNVVGSDDGRICLNSHIMMLMVSTCPAHKSLISHPIDSYIVRLESHACTHQLMVCLQHPLVN